MSKEYNSKNPSLTCIIFSAIPTCEGDYVHEVTHFEWWTIFVSLERFGTMLPFI